MKRKILNVWVVLMLVLSFNLMTSMPALAAATVTAASGGGAISADTASGPAWTSLGAITIAEGTGGDIAAGTFVLTIPSGFNFDTSSAPDVAVTGNGSLTANTPAAITATTITVTITKASSSSGNTLTIGGTTHIRVQPTAGTPLRSGNIFMTSGTINSVTGNVTSFGTLSEVAGSASALKVQTQPVGSASAGGGTLATQPVVQVVDAYQNVVTGYAASVAAAVKAGSGSWTLGGTTAVAASSGVAQFTNLTATTAGLSDITTAAITFSSGLLTSVNSSAFTVKAATVAGQAPVVLGSASTFAVLAGSTVTSIGTTVVTGDLGVSAGTSVTGFPPGTVSGTIHAGDATAAQAQIDLTTAYNDAAGRTPTAAAGDTLGGRTLTAGVYPGGALDLTGTLTLTGDANAVWIFQAASTLITAASSQVILSGGARAANVYWKVGSSATLGAGSNFKGNILAAVSITLNTGTTVDGRALARNGAVTLDTNTITFTHVAAPTVTAILPVSGPTAGGTSVTITGTGFVSGATVTIGSTFATNVAVVSNTSITATTPTGTAGAHNVVVTNPDGQSGTLTGGFTYVLPSTITLIAPSAINFGTFLVGANNVVSVTNGSVTVTQGNDSPSGWTCTAKDLNTSTNSGHLLSLNPLPLNDALMISQDGSTYASAATGLTYSGTGLTGPLPLQAKQTIVSGDVTGSYTIIIVFTAYISY